MLPLLAPGGFHMGVGFPRSTHRGTSPNRAAVEERVDELVHEAAKAKDIARIIRKIRKDMTTRICFIKAGEFDAGAYSFCKHNGTAEGAVRADAAMRAKYPDATFLNGMSDAQLIHTLGL